MTDLVESCARAIRDARALPGSKPKPTPSDVDYRAARAVIPLVLEKAAEVAEGKADEFNHQEAMATCDDWRSGYWTGRKEAGRAILTLKPEAQS